MTVVATFTPCPQSLVESSVRRSVRSGETSGHSRARQINPRALRRWKLRFENNDKIVAEIQRLWVLTYGSTLNLSYTPPGGSAVEVRFDSGTQSVLREAYAQATIEIVLEEVR